MYGKWSAVSQIDSKQMANCPLQMDNEFYEELDPNPEAPRRPRWMDKNWIKPEERESFLKDCDTDTVDSEWVCKEVIMGACVDRKGSGNYSGWSIVVRTVIRWEERNMIRMSIKVTHNRVPITETKKPADLERWEASHGIRRRSTRSLRSSRRNVRRRVRQDSNMGNATRIAC